MMEFSDVGGKWKISWPSTTYLLVYPFSGAAELFEQKMSRKLSDLKELKAWMHEKRLYLATAAMNAVRGRDGARDYLVHNLVATLLPEDSDEHLEAMREYEFMMSCPEIAEIGHGFVAIASQGEDE